MHCRVTAVESSALEELYLLLVALYVVHGLRNEVEDYFTEEFSSVIKLTIPIFLKVAYAL